MDFRRRPMRGLTLLEILVVLAIMIAVTSVGVVSYRQTRQVLRIRNGAAELADAVKVARGLAIKQNTYYGVRLDIAGGEFWVDELEIDTNATPPQLLVLRPKVTTPQKLPHGIRFAQATVTHSVDRALIPVSVETAAYPQAQFLEIYFGPSGASDGATVQLLRREDNPVYDANYYTVKVYSTTGASKVFPNARL